MFMMNILYLFFSFCYGNAPPSVLYSATVEGTSWDKEGETGQGGIVYRYRTCFWWFDSNGLVPLWLFFSSTRDKEKLTRAVWTCDSHIYQLDNNNNNKKQYLFPWQYLQLKSYVSINQSSALPFSLPWIKCCFWKGIILLILKLRRLGTVSTCLQRKLNIEAINWPSTIARVNTGIDIPTHRKTHLFSK